MGFLERRLKINGKRMLITDQKLWKRRNKNLPDREESQGKVRDQKIEIDLKINQEINHLEMVHRMVHQMNH